MAWKKSYSWAVLPPPCLKEIVPGVAAAQADDKIFGREFESTQSVDQQGNQLGIGGWIGFADKVGVELEVFAQAAFLLALVAEELGHGKPLDGLLVVTLVGGHHAGERGSHFRPQRNGPAALVHKVVELADDFRAAFGRKQLKRFEWRAVVFAEAIAFGHRPPLLKDELTRIGAPHIGVRERFRIKITETGESFHVRRIRKIFKLGKQEIRK